MKTALTRFRWIALTEGISYLLLLGVAMPLKYQWDMPLAVRIVGMIHGILFILYLVTGFQASRSEGWTRRFEIFAFIASLVPFGTFYLDRKISAKGSNST